MIRTSVTLSEEQYTRVSEHAQRGDLSVAWVIRQAVQQFLDRTEREEMPCSIRTIRVEEEDA